MHEHCTFIYFAHKYSISKVLILFLLYQNVLSINTLSENFKEDNQTENNYQNYFDSNHLCNGDTCKDLYEKIGYPYKQIKDTIDTLVMSRSFPPSSSTGREILPPPSLSGLDDFQFYILLHHFENLATYRMAAAPPLGFPESEVKCKESYRRRYLLKEEDIDGKLQYIINVEGFYQPTDITTCYNKTLSCVQQDMTPENYDYRCTQMYADVELFTFPVTENITADARIISLFRIPNGCICKEVRKHDTY